MTTEPTTTDTDASVPTDADVLELARLGLAFYHQTTMMHFLMACGREDTTDFTAVQAERVALATRMTEIQDSLSEEAREYMRMERMTPAHRKPQPVKVQTLSLAKEEN